MNSTCSELECSAPAVCRGFCGRHYRRRNVAGTLPPKKTLREVLGQGVRVGPVPAIAPELGPCLIWTGKPDKAGYGHRTWEGIRHYAHRLAWIAYCGPIPDGHDIDHRCHVTMCIRVDHLRPTTRSENLQNRAGATRGNSSSRHRGVSYSKRDRRWVAKAKRRGVTYSGGSYLTEQEAADAARELRLRLHTHNDVDRR